MHTIQAGILNQDLLIKLETHVPTQHQEKKAVYFNKACINHEEETKLKMCILLSGKQEKQSSFSKHSKIQHRNTERTFFRKPFTKKWIQGN